MIAEQLARAIDDGVRRIGQLAIVPDTAGAAYAVCHADDLEQLREDPSALEVHHDPEEARRLSTWAADGHYRFTKGELSLRGGWCLLLDGAESLRRTLDGFYPAAVGLWLAERGGGADPEHLRDKLNRQTGMYRFARNISNEGAQRLVREVCGPGNCCVKKILWQVDRETPLEDSEASRFPGFIGEAAESIPLLCREACNHFVAECRKASKAEFEAKQD